MIRFEDLSTDVTLRLFNTPREVRIRCEGWITVPYACGYLAWDGESKWEDAHGPLPKDWIPSPRLMSSIRDGEVPNRTDMVVSLYNAEGRFVQLPLIFFNADAALAYVREYFGSDTEGTALEGEASFDAQGLVCVRINAAEALPKLQPGQYLVVESELRFEAKRAKALQ